MVSSLCSMCFSKYWFYRGFFTTRLKATFVDKSSGVEVGGMDLRLGSWRPFELNGYCILFGERFHVSGSDNLWQVVHSDRPCECALSFSPGFLRWYLKEASISCAERTIRLAPSWREVRFYEEGGAYDSGGIMNMDLGLNSPIFSGDAAWMDDSTSLNVIASLLCLLIWQPVVTPDS